VTRLVFGHFAIAIVFFRAWRDSAWNQWLCDFGLIASALVVPYAPGFGTRCDVREWRRLIDCPVGVFDRKRSL